MSRKGFINIYFLSIFTLATLLAAIITSNQQNLTKMRINAIKANDYLYQENIVIAYLKCELKNEREFESQKVINDVAFSCSANDTSVIVTITSPEFEILEVELLDDRIYDFSYTRYPDRIEY